MRVLLLLISFSLSFSLTLEEAKRLALENQLEVVKGELDLRKLEERIREAKGGILPRINLTATYIRWDRNYISAFVPPDKYSATLTLNQSLFDRVVWTALELARTSRELQELVLGDVRQTVLAEVEKLFWAVLLKREILREKERSLTYWENYYLMVKEKYEKGVVPRFEFLRARAQFRQARADLIRAQSDLRASLNSLKSFLGLTGEVSVEGKLLKTDIPSGDPYRLLEENNPTLKVLRKTLELRRLTVEARRSEFYPRLSFFFNYNWENIMDFTNGRLKEDFRHGYNLGLKLELPLFEGGSRVARIAQEELERVKVDRELEFTRRKLLNELETLLARIRSAEEEIKAREDTLLAAEESLRFATERYAYGVGSQVELLDARRNYESAKLLYLESIYAYNSLVADLKRMLGL
ncbi:MAG TPA: TolC family protein [Aquifex aeolicus]|uniref:TolC family protein n=1 Tax=Aquifex aeolicus TaxID=63363 RepID=A0A7C5L2B2_AQUAO|nr:TolC family protein [Aquifex aeolicus]